MNSYKIGGKYDIISLNNWRNSMENYKLNLIDINLNYFHFIYKKI